jgi:hypothetical protein
MAGLPPGYEERLVEARNSSPATSRPLPPPPPPLPATAPVLSWSAATSNAMRTAIGIL